MIQEKVQTCQFVKEKIQSKWIKVDKKQIKIKLLSMASCYSWRIYRGGSKHCFPLIRYGFCSSDALYSSNLSFGMFIFLLTAFNISDIYYFRLNLSHVLLIKVLFIKRACNIVF